MTQPRRRRLASSPFAPPPEIVHPVFEEGQRVSHDAYGLGRVVGRPSATNVSIDFGGEVRHIPLPSSKFVVL